MANCEIVTAEGENTLSFFERECHYDAAVNEATGREMNHGIRATSPL